MKIVPSGVTAATTTTTTTTIPTTTTTTTTIPTGDFLAPTGAIIVLMCYSIGPQPLFEILSISANI